MTEMTDHDTADHGTPVGEAAPAGDDTPAGPSSARAGVVSIFLTTVPPEQLDEYRLLPFDADGDRSPFRLEVDAGLVSVDPELLEVDGFVEPADDPVAELTGYSAGASFADAAAVDLSRLRTDEHTGLVLVYDHDARRGAGTPEESALTLVGVYAYDWRL
ncbi:hypothetical protein ACWFNE_17835 [Cellulomonas sp. NPDC055163]